MTFKKQIITFLNNWKLTLLILLLTGIFYFLGLMSEKKLFVNISEWIFFISIILTFLSGVYALVRLQFIRGLGLIGIVILTLIFLGSFLMFYPNDFYADDLEIPKNIKFEKPLGNFEILNKTDSVTIFKEYNLNFNLVNSFQQGTYDYYVWFKPTQKGNMFLRIFEITQETPLSSERIETSSRIKIKSGEDSLKLYKQHFTIYEGDWGKPYGARLEFWFEPIKGKSYKILQKNYIVEGWMR
jgi:energy-coupling factor transporter transmembrane protein EcfT